VVCYYCGKPADTLQRNAARKSFMPCTIAYMARGRTREKGRAAKAPLPSKGKSGRRRSPRGRKQWGETRLIVLTGTIKGIPARFLVDGGATHNFIDEKLFWELGILSLAKESPDTIKLANGQMESSCLVLPKARTHISTHKDSLKFHATRLKGFDAILGKEWLAKTNPDIDWRQNTLQFEYNGKVHTLRTSPEEDIDFSIRHMMLTHTELEKAFT